MGLATARKLAQHGLNIIVVHRNARAQMEGIEKDFELIRDMSVQCINFNKDAFNAQKRQEIITDIQLAIGASSTIKVLVHSVAKGNLKPMVSNDEADLKNDDFSLTINAMGISLYDWTKELLKANLFGEDARVISFTSEGNTKAWKNYAAVSAAKVTLEAITRSIALEMAPLALRQTAFRLE